MPADEDVRLLRRNYHRAKASLSGRSKQAREAAVAGFGGFVAIFLLAQLSSNLGHVLLIAPFGASCVLVFALPQTPVAQPRNVIGGHLVATVIGLAISALLGATPLGFSVGVGLAIVAMSLTSTLHPPAGADPIVAIALGASWSFLFVPVLLGAALIVAIGLLFHWKISGKPYPATPLR